MPLHHFIVDLFRTKDLPYSESSTSRNRTTRVSMVVEMHNNSGILLTEMPLRNCVPPTS